MLNLHPRWQICASCLLSPCIMLSFLLFATSMCIISLKLVKHVHLFIHFPPSCIMHFFPFLLLRQKKKKKKGETGKIDMNQETRGLSYKMVFLKRYLRLFIGEMSWLRNLLDNNNALTVCKIT